MWEEKLKELYDQILPPNSQGRLADNPSLFTRVIIDRLPRLYPFLALCKDLEQETLTWHYMCFEYSLEEFLNGGYDQKISNERRRNLKVTELYHRPFNEYHFIE